MCVILYACVCAFINILSWFQIIYLIPNLQNMSTNNTFFVHKFIPTILQVDKQYSIFVYERL